MRPVNAQWLMRVKEAFVCLALQSWQQSGQKQTYILSQTELYNSDWKLRERGRQRKSSERAGDRDGLSMVRQEKLQGCQTVQKASISEELYLSFARPEKNLRPRLSSRDGWEIGQPALPTLPCEPRQPTNKLATIHRLPPLSEGTRCCNLAQC